MEIALRFSLHRVSDSKPAKVVSSCINALGCIYIRQEYSALLAIKSFLVQQYTGEIYISKVNRLSSRERLFLLVFRFFLSLLWWNSTNELFRWVKRQGLYGCDSYGRILWDTTAKLILPLRKYDYIEKKRKK